MNKINFFKILLTVSKLLLKLLIKIIFWFLFIGMPIHLVIQFVTVLDWITFVSLCGYILLLTAYIEQNKK